MFSMEKTFFKLFISLYFFWSGWSLFLSLDRPFRINKEVIMITL